MKWIIVWLTVALLQVHATGLSQQLTLRLTHAPLRDLLREVEHQTGYIAIYGKKLLDKATPVDISCDRCGLIQALDQGFRDQPLDYVLEDNKYIVIHLRAPAMMTPATPPSRTVGKVVGPDGKPLAGINVMVKGTSNGAVTNSDGVFVIDAKEGDVLLISGIGYATREVIVTQERLVQVTLHIESVALDTTAVVLNTGYQHLPPERASGSFDLINNQLLNRSASTDVLSRLDGVASGLLFNRSANKLFADASKGGDPVVSVRGRSTLFANTSPLIVLDNFPYDGDISNINPNDIESVTVLKDAAAASIWGVRAGNGVIVLTSKKGRLNTKPMVSFTTNVSVSEKPNQYAVPQLSSAEYIGLEKKLFGLGYYDVYLNFLPYFVQTPVVDLLEQERKGNITTADLNTQLDALSKVDINKEMDQYFYQHAISQQYSLNVSGGSANDQYYFSAGWDRNFGSRVADGLHRVTINARNTYKLLQQRLECTTDVVVTRSKSVGNYNPYIPNYPYARLVDQGGNALPVAFGFRQASKDALVSQGLFDWNYYPYAERNRKDKTSDGMDYRLSAGLTYQLLPERLSLSVNYQYQQGSTDLNMLSDMSTYNARSYIDLFAQIDGSGNITYPVPIGSIYQLNHTTYSSHTGRAQASYRDRFGTDHELSLLGGFEVKDYQSAAWGNILYGYNAANGTSIPVDFATELPTAIDGSTSRIQGITGVNTTADRFVSYYANGSYTYQGKYVATGSFRRDESNLFGVQANKKGVPLYSAGLAWNLHQEGFYKVAWLPYLRVRFTGGYNGNLTKSLSAYTTATDHGYSIFNVPTEAIVNPPNANLGWERVKVINGAVDMATPGRRIAATVEYYIKKGENLIGNSAVAPQTGISSFTGNTADMITHGVDLTVNTVNVKGKFDWTSQFLLTYVHDKVTTYLMPAGVNSNYVSHNYANPFVGRPFNALFAYRYKGLDAAGDPISYLGGKESQDYSSIVNSTDPGDLKYMGSATPTVYGSLLNSFSYKGFELSALLTYRMGYYFRRGSYISSSVGYQQADYDKRWQNPGDEQRTEVPAFSYPFNPVRDILYQGSEVLVVRGDQLRWQDVRLGYTIPRRNHGMTIRCYGMVNNVGILWRANRLHLDPDYVGNGSYTLPSPRSYTLGVSANF